MKIVFRVDASIQIGIGHVMRCLTLADALCKEGAKCLFVCREHSGNFTEQISKRGHQVQVLPIEQIAGPLCKAESDISSPAHAHWLGGDWLTDARQTADCIGTQPAEWLIVDHYALDMRWEGQLRTNCRKIMVIDDLADRHHDCDLLLDQTFGRCFQDYEQLVPEGGAILTGSRYALLRPDFTQWREHSLKRRIEPELKHLLVTMGGADKDNVSSQVLEALNESSLPDDCRITILMGTVAPHLELVKQIATAMPWPTTVRVNVNNVAELMASSDLCIGAAGSTTWERCCLGLPTIQVIIAENQRMIGELLADAQAIVLLNWQTLDVDLKKILKNLTIEEFIALSTRSRQVADGMGVERVISRLTL